FIAHVTRQFIAGLLSTIPTGQQSALQRWSVQTLSGLDCSLARSIVSGRWHSLKPALVNRLSASRADSIRPFVNPQKRLVNVRYELRFTLAHAESYLAVHVLQRHIHAVLDAVIGVRCCGSLPRTHMLGVLSKLPL